LFDDVADPICPARHRKPAGLVEWQSATAVHQLVDGGALGQRAISGLRDAEDVRMRGVQPVGRGLVDAGGEAAGGGARIDGILATPVEPLGLSGRADGRSEFACPLSALSRTTQHRPVERGTSDGRPALRDGVV
jgi:hypothetical protein